MALDSINLTMTLREDRLPDLSGSRVLHLALEQWLPPFFRPFECRGAIGAERLELAATAPEGPAGAWQGEHLNDASPLTTVNSDASGVIPLLAGYLKADEPTAYVTLTGALNHQPPLP